MGLLENKARARLFYKYLSRVYDRVNPFVWNAEMRSEALSLLEFEQREGLVSHLRVPDEGVHPIVDP